MAQFRHILWRSQIVFIAMLLVLSACNGGTPLTPTPQPPPTEPPAPEPIVLASPTNSSPEIVTLAASPKEICPGDQTSLVAVVVDADGDELKYVWNSEVGTISNPTEDATGGEADYLGPASPGSDTVELTVSDGKGGTAKQQANVTVRGDCAPIVKIESPSNIIECFEDACQFEIKGSTSSIVSRSDFNDLRLYVLVFPATPPGAGWYIQVQPASIQVSDGLWSQPTSWIGSTAAPVENGDTLKVVAVVVHKDAVSETIHGSRTIDQMTARNDDNVVKEPRNISASLFVMSDVVTLTVQKPP